MSTWPPSPRPLPNVSRVDGQQHDDRADAGRDRQGRGAARRRSSRRRTSICGSARATTRCTAWHSRVDATMDAATKTSSGIDSLTLNLDVTTRRCQRARRVGAVFGRHGRRSSRRPSWACWARSWAARPPAEPAHADPARRGAARPRGPSLWSRPVRPPPQLVLLDVDFTLIRPRRVFDANGYAELGARFGVRLDPARYEQARQDAFHVWQAGTLEHRSAQHRRFAIEIVRGMGAPRAVAEQIGIAAEQEWGDPGNFELFPDVVPAARRPARDAAARSGSSPTPIASSSRSPRSSASRVDFALASSAHGRRKPCATIFAAALALGGAAPEDGGDGGRQPRRRHRGRARAAACAPCSSTAATATRTTPGERIARPRRAAGAARARAALPRQTGARHEPRARERYAARARAAARAGRRASSPAFISAQRSQVAPRSCVCTT